MKNKITHIITAACLMLTSLFTMYSCTKKATDPCAGVNCMHGGVCNKGVCTCPTGYTGIYCENKTSTSLAYKNNTSTPITITVNGTTQTINIGSSVTFTGDAGNAANGTASTSGTTVGGGTKGVIMQWNLNNSFPASGTQTIDLNVPSDYFFLYMQNASGASITELYTNNGNSYQMTEPVNIPNNGTNYGVGYYHASSVVYLAAVASDASAYTNTATFSLVNNQTFNWIFF